MSENLAVVKVSATAEDKVDPDLAVFTLRFGKKCETQQECADDFAAEQDRVIRALEPFGSFVSVSGLSKTLVYGMNLALPWPKSSLVLPVKPP